MSGFGIAPAKTSPDADPNLLAARQQLQMGVRRGANWFYWIAGLSVVNSVMAMSGSNGRFIVGLGMTEIVDEIARDLGKTGTIAGLVVNVFAVGVFVMLGVFANKYHKWAFLAGMALYTLDGAILVMAQQWLSVAFHGWVLYWLYAGFKRVSEAEELTQRFQLHAV